MSSPRVSLEECLNVINPTPDNQLTDLNCKDWENTDYVSSWVKYLVLLSLTPSLLQNEAPDLYHLRREILNEYPYKSNALNFDDFDQIWRFSFPEQQLECVVTANAPELTQPSSDLEW
jgi:hypothetical protein